jgi:hypothetical protein
MTADDRKKLGHSGPITEGAIRRFAEKGRDPLKLVLEAIKEAKKTLPAKAQGKSVSPVIVSDSFKSLLQIFDDMERGEETDQEVRDLVVVMRQQIGSDKDTHRTFEAIKKRITEFSKQRKARAADATSVEPGGAEPK